MKISMVTTVVLALGIAAGSLAQNIATTRNAPLDVELEPAKMARVDNSDVKRKRAYPMQPPTIPTRWTSTRWISMPTTAM